MVRVDREPVRFEHDPCELGEDLVRRFDRGAAVLADEMAVNLRRKVVGSGTMTEMGVRHNPQTLEFVEIPIHRGKVDVRRAPLKVVGDLLSGEVSLRLDETPDQKPPRSRDPVPLGPEHREDVLDALFEDRRVLFGHETSLRRSRRPQDPMNRPPRRSVG